MAMLKDFGLWSLVKARIRPLGSRGGPPSHRTTGLTAPRTLPVAGRIDLHGDTIAHAHDRVRAYLSAARVAGLASVEVVTGRSGSIRQEFPTWAALHQDVRRIEVLHGGGAFRVHLRRSRT